MGGAQCCCKEAEAKPSDIVLSPSIGVDGEVHPWASSPLDGTLWDQNGPDFTYQILGRELGKSLGFDARHQSGKLLVTNIHPEGPIAKHNEELEQLQKPVLMVGDCITCINGKTADHLMTFELRYKPDLTLHIHRSTE